VIDFQAGREVVVGGVVEQRQIVGVSEGFDSDECVEQRGAELLGLLELCGPVAQILEDIQIGGFGEQSGGFGGEIVSVHLKELEEEAEVKAVKDFRAGEEGKPGTDLDVLGHNSDVRWEPTRVWRPISEKGPEQGSW
jgi:hypothetical protein